ncbi:prostaglandin E synthase 2-like [Xyrauchen texanus]|uniref:prostaglandin E synthase 2-like n=1 Tax=Xyrauchen texanus TaxID=154827 RepID=UPI00224208A4|nr:prostaglandin E synthase 2-like [Xyrauchen texanus]
MMAARWIGTGSVLLLGGATGLYHSIKQSLDQRTLAQADSGWGGSQVNLTLYQYDRCTQCSQLRAFLDYYGIEYHTQHVKWSQYRSVPVLTIDGGDSLELNDASVIISAMKTCMIDRSRSLSEVIRFYPQLTSTNFFGQEVTEFTNKYWVMLNEIAVESVYPSKSARKEEVRWRRWTDEWLLHLVSPNVFRTPSEALAACGLIVREGRFGAVDGVLVKYVGAVTMFLLSKLLKVWYRLQDDVREDLYSAVNEWVTAIGRRRTFMGGDEPNLADLAVFGVLRTIEGLQAFDDIMEKTKVKKWYLAMERATEEHLGQSDASMSLSEALTSVKSQSASAS